MSEKVELVMEPIAVSPAEAAVLLGISRTTVYEVMGRADFPSFKVGARCLIPVRELKDWAAAQAEGQKEAAQVLTHQGGGVEQSLTATVSASNHSKNKRKLQGGFFDK